MLTKAFAITVPLRTVHAETLYGLLALPAETEALVICARANKSRRQTLINKWVSAALNRKGIGTLLLDLVPKDGLNRRFQFDLMAQRLDLTTRWLLEQPGMGHLRIGYFGVSIGAGAAIRAAAHGGKELTLWSVRGDIRIWRMKSSRKSPLPCFLLSENVIR